MRGTISRSGRNSWRIKYDLPKGQDGKRRTAYETIRGSKKEAYAKLAERIAARGKGTHVEPSKITVAAYVAARITHWSAAGVTGAKTTQRYEVLLKHQVAPHIGAIPLQKLGTIDIEQWHSALKAAGLAHGTVKMANKLLVKALDDAMRHSVLSRNVAALQRVPKGTKQAVPIIRADQVDAVVNKLRGTAIYERALLAITCGLRAGEINGLPWSAVDLDRKTIRIVQATEEVMGQPVRIKVPKTEAGRRAITLPDIAVEALRALHGRTFGGNVVRLAVRRDDALVFPAMDGGPAGTANLSKQWRRTVEALGLPSVRLHALRHTHASQLIAAGLPLPTIAARLGHANAGVTLKTYAHLFEKDDSAAAAVINGAIPVRKS